MYIFENPLVIDLPLLYRELKKYEENQASEKKEIIDMVVAHHGMLNFKMNNTFLFFRVRYIKNSKIEMLQDILWPPPQTSCKSNNRLGGDVFYIASSLHTALAEARGAYERAVVSAFKLKSNKALRIIPIGEISKIVNGFNGHIINRERFKDYIGRLNAAFAANENLTLSYLVQDNFICDQVLSNDPDISSYTIRSIINKTINIDTIGYPSIKSQDGYNYGVLKDNFHNCFELVYASKLKVYKIYGKYFKTETTDYLYKIDSEGRLTWKQNESGIDNFFYQLLID